MKNIIGHQKQIEQLLSSLKEKRVPHAYLFSGLEGIGKKTLAIGFAQALNCPEKTEGACSRCMACNKIAGNSHPDFHSITPEGQTIKIDLIRDLKQKIYLHPLEGKVKVILIDKAESLTEAAANALLKILEEPPDQTHFILISSRPSKLLPTIRSRCQHLEFAPLTPEQIEELLIRTGMDKKEAGERTRFAEGSFQRAKEWDPQFFSGIQKQIEILKKNPGTSSVLDLAENWSEAPEKIVSILRCLTHLWHQRLINPDCEGIEENMHQWDVIQKTWGSLETYANKQLLVENLLFTLARSSHCR